MSLNKVLTFEKSLTEWADLKKIIQKPRVQSIINNSTFSYSYVMDFAQTRRIDLKPCITLRKELVPTDKITKFNRTFLYSYITGNYNLRSQ